MMAGPAHASAATFDKLTYLTFSGRVQIPGVTLDAGTYRFRLADPDSSRHVVQVLSNDGSTVYAMFNTIPDNRVTVTREATVTFRETPAGVPPAVKSLFYGGEHRGYQFVYPKGEPIVTAERSNQPEILYVPRAAAPTTSAKAAETTSAVPAPESIDSSAAEAQPPQQPAPELPRTASPIPMVALGGFGSLVIGLGLGLLRRVVS
jgi:hypothetical protein